MNSNGPNYHKVSVTTPNRFNSIRSLTSESICTKTNPCTLGVARTRGWHKTPEQRMRSGFPFARKGAARVWLHYLPAGSITNWTEIKKTFLEKYFPASRASYMKKQISNIEQEDGESLYE